MVKVALILLAAGGATRMGRLKQLLPIAGEPMVRRAARTALRSPCSFVFVVTGNEEAAVSKALHGLAVRTIHNAEWSKGIGSSIRAGIRGASADPIEGAILALADQPQIRSEHLEALIALHQSSRRPIIASAYAGTLGVPAFFHRDVFPELLGLPPDAGCKGVILRSQERVASLSLPEAEADIDTPEDYQDLEPSLRSA